MDTRKKTPVDAHVVDRTALRTKELSSIAGASGVCTVGDVAIYLRIARSTAYALVQKKQIPILRINGSIRVPIAAFLDWVGKNTEIEDC